MARSLCSGVLEQVQDAIARELAAVRREDGRPLALLDIGCWDGAATVRYREILGGPASGIEVFAAEAARARARGIDVAELDLETQPFPWPDASVDVVVANQVFEHLKNVFLPMSELARVVRPGGVLVFSVPNLASLHNRAMLACGLQPTSIRTFGPHVRGFTFRQMREFLTRGGYFEVVRAAGVGFYPLPAGPASPLARAWPAACHTPVFVARRVAPLGARPPWLAYVEGEREAGQQTFYAPAEASAAATAERRA